MNANATPKRADNDSKSLEMGKVITITIFTMGDEGHHLFYRATTTTTHIYQSLIS
jgi:hypothetical protein